MSDNSPAFGSQATIPPFLVQTLRQGGFTEAIPNAGLHRSLT